MRTKATLIIGAIGLLIAAGQVRAMAQPAADRSTIEDIRNKLLRLPYTACLTSSRSATTREP